MGTLGWLLVLPLAIGACVGWQMHRYPGGWAYAFGAAYTADRQNLAQARRGVHDLERGAHQERSEAKAGVRNAEAAYRRHISTIERQLSELRQPGWGVLREQLGDLVLHEHVLLVKEEVVPLAGLRVRFEEAKHNHHIYVTRPDGRVRFESFPHELHEEGVVRHFAVRIENEAAAENAFRERHEGFVAEAEISLQRARADTASQAAARAQLAQVTEQQRADSRIKIARSELEVEQERWRALTGHRPR